jgi:hypothetical protein
MEWKYDEKFDKLTKIRFDQELDNRTSVDNIYKLLVAIAFAIAIMIGSTKK